MLYYIVLYYTYIYIGCMVKWREPLLGLVADCHGQLLTHPSHLVIA